jgi:hypothetical protein
MKKPKLRLVPTVENENIYQHHFLAEGIFTTSKDDINYIKQYIKTFNDRRLKEEHNLYTSIEKPTILENYFKDFIKQEIGTRGIGV